jgi:5'-3' exonuclease
LPRIHLVDATYELFRHWFAHPQRKAPNGREVGAVRGLLLTLLGLVRDEGATHVACATDHVVRSFRNDLYDGYKTEIGVPADLLAQFPLAEDAMRALGMVVWPMVEFEADDALAAGVAKFSGQADQVIIATVDKDLAQCVKGDHVVMSDRRRKKVLDEAGVLAKYGVLPASIPDWLALVGDTSDGYPGLSGWGEKTAAAVLREYGTIEAIPLEAAAWSAQVRGAERLAETLRERMSEALLYKRLATLRTDAPVPESLDDLAWRGATPALRDLTKELGFPDLCARVPRWTDGGGARAATP